MGRIRIETIEAMGESGANSCYAGRALQRGKRRAIELRASVTLRPPTASATLSVREPQEMSGATTGRGNGRFRRPNTRLSRRLGEFSILGGGSLNWEQHYRFQCVNCQCGGDLSWMEDGSPKQLVCRNPECLHPGTPYIQDTILYVIRMHRYWHPITVKSPRPARNPGRIQDPPLLSGKPLNESDIPYFRGKAQVQELLMSLGRRCVVEMRRNRRLRWQGRGGDSQGRG